MNLITGIDVTADALEAQKTRLDIVAQHIANAQSKYAEADKRLDRFETKLERAANLEIETRATDPPALPRALDSAA